MQPGSKNTRFSQGYQPQPKQASRPKQTDPAEAWDDWLRRFFPDYFSLPFADHHRELWEWVWSLKPGLRPSPLVAIWPRGGGKSTNAEAACVAVAARGSRPYAIYVCETQEQADDHVGNVAAMLESSSIEKVYPDLSNRALTKFGQSKGWKRNRLRTASGFTIDALGLDTAARGIKIDADRPGFIILDDLDGENDSPKATEKKARTLTRKILPAAAADAAVLAVQNLVHPDSIFAQLADDRADFLADRIVSGPHRAVDGLTYERRGGRVIVTGGTPTWEGMGLDRVQEMIDRDGLSAFLAESQHEQTKEGKAFPEWDRAVHVCQPFKVPAEWPRWRGLDYGYASPFACVWLALAPSGTIYVYRELYATRVLDRDQAMQIKLLSTGEPIRATFADPSMWAARHNGYQIQAPAASYAEMGVALTPANNDRKVGMRRFHDVLMWQAASEAEGLPFLPPQLQVFSTCEQFIRSVPALDPDPRDPEDVDTTQDDHLFDAARYALTGMALPVPQKTRVRFGKR